MKRKPPPSAIAVACLVVKSGYFKWLVESLKRNSCTLNDRWLRLAAASAQCLVGEIPGHLEVLQGRDKTNHVTHSVRATLCYSPEHSPATSRPSAHLGSYSSGHGNPPPEQNCFFRNLITDHHRLFCSLMPPRDEALLYLSVWAIYSNPASAVLVFFIDPSQK
jgi:hypothetical protein